jgi:hypothetical protein
VDPDSAGGALVLNRTCALKESRQAAALAAPAPTKKK